MSKKKKQPERSFTGWVERPLWERIFIVLVLVTAALVVLVMLNGDR